MSSYESNMVKGNCSVKLFIWTDLFGLYPNEFVTQNCRIGVLTHYIMNGMCYCINSFVNHVSEAKLRCVGVRAVKCLHVFGSIAHTFL